MKKMMTLFCFIFISYVSIGQDCNITVTGFIFDKKTNAPLEFSNVYFENIKKGTVTDEEGFFRIENICPDEYHIKFSHIGCEEEEFFVKIKGDTLLNIFLSHHTELLDEVVIHGNQENNSTESSQTISRVDIVNQSNKNLSDVLESITGVSVLKNGSGISKPVIHGMYGNRIAILNNGIAQAGQQWGNDHAPEIDPFVADHLSVIKGASALAYGSNSLGGIVLVEPAELKDDPHLHGGVNYVFQTNGRGHTLNSMFGKKSKFASWRFLGTLKRQGDPHTPDYFLTNTGKQENNAAIQIEKEFSDKLKTDFYYSFFQTKIGILKGSHIGNLTDLEQAIGREEPFSISDTFFYNIAFPRQEVNHHLIKTETKYFLNTDNVIKFKYGGQLNQRREFDIRRGINKEKPALSLSLYSHQLETAYNGLLNPHLFLKTGLQFEMTDNDNVPETGIAPLIPNYRSYQTSAYSIFQFEKKENLVFEIGGRYSLKKLTVKTFATTFPNELEILNHTFHKYAFSTGFRWNNNKQFGTNFNVGYLARAPEVNELYSFGLHQGVSGIEEGKRNLNVEKSIKATWTLDFNLKKQLFIQALGYFQNINDYIYLEPQKEFRLTIRGAFPVFIYQQTNATIAGLDLLVKYEPNRNLKFITKYARIEGRDTKNNLGLINIPSNNILSSITYTFNNDGKWQNNFFTINNKTIFQQKNITAQQDFLEPPLGYSLLGLHAGTNREIGETDVKFIVRVENLLNVKYRDYLNRQRYFADELGRNISLNMNIEF